MTEAGDDVETRLSKSLDQIIQEGGGGDEGLTTRPGKGRYGDRDRFVDRERFGDRDRRGRGGRGRFGGRGPGGPFVVGRGEGRGLGGRGGGFVPMIHLSYFWSTDPMGNESVKVHLLKTDVVEVKSNGDVILNTGGFKNWMTRAAMNVVLGPVGIKVDGEDGDREPWKVKKGAWSQDLENTLKISAFASRDWPVVRMALEGLPTSVTRDTPVLPSVLGKRPPPPQPVPPPMYVYPFPPPPPPHYGGFFPRGGPKRFRLG